MLHVQAQTVLLGGCHQDKLTHLLHSPVSEQCKFNRQALQRLLKGLPCATAERGPGGERGCVRSQSTRENKTRGETLKALNPPGQPAHLPTQPLVIRWDLSPPPQVTVHTSMLRRWSPAWRSCLPQCRGSKSSHGVLSPLRGSNELLSLIQTMGTMCCEMQASTRVWRNPRSFA